MTILLEVLDRQLDLDGDQRSAIEQLLVDQRDDFDAVNAQVAHERARLREQLFERSQAILRTEQRQRFREMNAQARERSGL